jgi:hypothetical protein
VQLFSNAAAITTKCIGKRQEKEETYSCLLCFSNPRHVYFMTKIICLESILEKLT